MNNKFPVSLKRQQGSALTMLIVALFFAGLLTFVLKVGPAYLDDFTIQEALENLENIEGLSKMGPAQVRETINKQLRVNSVRGFDPKNITVEKDGGLVLVNVDYEVRNNLFGSVDTIVHFQHEYEFKGK
ncbi:DUF4845 domain-containing protein [Marinobacter sp.]|uniref:DUF4845 domain-containing protein n=1 Tax=Marinobacter sp. TaxID=50741 RepID=UPI00356ACF9B